MCWILVISIHAHMGQANTDCPIEKLSSIVRSVSMNQDNRVGAQTHQNSSSSNRNTPVPWDPQTGQERPNSRGSNHRRASRDSQAQGERDARDRERDAREVQRERVERYGSQSGRTPHVRQESGNTGVVNPSNEYGGERETHQNNTGRRHDYDVQSMETAISSPRASMTKNPIPAPTVTVRSEYPTLTRSRQQQSLTCLVTIEVPEGKWRPDPADIRGAPVMPPLQQDSNTFSNRPKSPVQAPQNDWQFESNETLEEITEDLRVRVDNWHGLDFQRYMQSLLLSASIF